MNTPLLLLPAAKTLTGLAGHLGVLRLRSSRMDWQCVRGRPVGTWPGPKVSTWAWAKREDALRSAIPRRRPCSAGELAEDPSGFGDSAECHDRGTARQGVRRGTQLRQSQSLL